LPVYPIIHKETGEQKEVKLTLAEWETFKEENPSWGRDWSQGCASVGEAGEVMDRLLKKHPSWGEVLKKVNKSAGSKSQMQL
jgi:hypothetical protein